MSFSNFFGITFISGGNYSGQTINTQTYLHRNLQSMNLSNCTLRFINFSGSNLSGTNFSGATIENCIFTGCNLSNCNMNETIIRSSLYNNTNLSSSTLNNSILISSSFERTNIIGPNTFINTRFTSCNCKKSFIYKINMFNCTLEGTIFDNSTINRLQTIMTRFTNVSWKSNKITNTKFLDGSRLIENNFRDAILTDDWYYKTDLSGSDFVSTTVNNVYFHKLINIENVSLPDERYTWRKTTDQSDTEPESYSMVGPNLYLLDIDFSEKDISGINFIGSSFQKVICLVL